jgi:ABC-type Fe3+-hydroxamate transport system substrate-binding protein
MIVPAGEKITDAQVAAAMPDLIVLAWAATGTKADQEQAYKVAAWKDVPAIRSRNVHVISDELLNTPGPPLIEGVRQLWNVLHSQNRGAYENQEEDNAGTLRALRNAAR